MSRLILDTSGYSEFVRRARGFVEVIESATAVFVPFATLAELRYGFRYGLRREQNEQRLVAFLSLPGVQQLYADERTTHAYADLHAYLRRQGTPLPINDIWIAALAVQHDLILVARDEHFDRLPQLRRL